MRAFRFTFPGYYLGGSAVVVARDRESALAMLQEHDGWKELVERQPMSVECREINLDEPNVATFDNGDY